MDRHVKIIRSDRDRQIVIDWLKRAPEGYRVEVKAPKRSDAQNDRLWAMLSVVAKRADIGGKRFSAEAWKCIFMQAIGKESKFLPTLEGDSFFPSGFRSSDLSVREMSDLQTFIEAWAAQAGVEIFMEG